MRRSFWKKPAGEPARPGGFHASACDGHSLYLDHIVRPHQPGDGGSHLSDRSGFVREAPAGWTKTLPPLRRRDGIVKMSEGAQSG